MKRGIKIGGILVACILAASLLGYAVGSHKSADQPKQTESDTTQTETTTLQQTTTEPETTTATTAQPTSSASESDSGGEQLLGKWTDGSGMSGYEFFKNGTVKVTYVNMTLPVINIPVNGSYEGTYQVNSDEVTITFSIYTAAITNTYTYTVDDSQLTLVNKEDNSKTVYMHTTETDTSKTESAQTTQQVKSDNDELVGAWVSNDKNIIYTFNADSSFTAANKAENKEYKGIYIYDGDTLTVQYTDGEKKTQKLDCVQSKSSITLIDENGEQIFLVRVGTGSSVFSDASALIGKWMDGAEMSGYEFHDDGVVTVTYVNLTIPVVNIPVNGTYNGSYTVSGDTVNISFSVYGKVIRRTFTFAVDGEALELTDTSDGNTVTYIKK